MREKGIDISQQRSKDVREYLGQSFRYIIKVCDNANERCPVFPGTSVRLHWSFPDPADAEGTEEEKLRVFRPIRDAIEAAVRQFVSEASEG